MVFYMLVQVGGSTPVDSALGKAWADYAGPTFPVTDSGKGERVFFMADFHAWWKANRDPVNDLPLLHEWLGRDFARNMVVPMCERLAQYRP